MTPASVASLRARLPTTPRGQSLLALAIYAALGLLLFGHQALGDPAHTCVCGGVGDPGLFMWSMKWWPYAVLHGHNPFITHNIWTPAGANLAASTSVPAPAVLLWPITAAFGPVASYNLAAFTAPVLGAWFAFRLCRYLRSGWLAALFGGYIFGFSSYELGQLIGHLHLVFIFLIPAGVHLVLLRLDERIPQRRFTILFAVGIGLQILLSTEVLFTSLFFGAFALFVAYLLIPARRPGIRGLLAPIVLGGLAAAVVLSPMLYEAVKGLGKSPSVSFPALADRYSADPLNYLLPTPITLLGGSWATSLADKYNQGANLTGTFAESGAYIGIPLLIAGLWAVVASWRRPATRFALAMIVVLFVCSLGAHLHVVKPPLPMPARGYSPSIPLPWHVVAHLPVFDHVLPVRFSVFIFLILGVLVSQWLTQRDGLARWRWGLAALAVIALLPVVGKGFWSGTIPDPAFFENATYKRYLKPNEPVLPLPARSGETMLWQARTNMYYRMASGYISIEIPRDYFNDQVVQNIISKDGTGAISPRNLPTAFKDFLDRHNIGAVVASPSTAAIWHTVLSELHLHTQRVAGIDFTPVVRPSTYQVWGTEFQLQQGSDQRLFRWLEQPRGTVRFVNPGAARRTVLSFRLVRYGTTAPVTLTFPDGQTQVVTVGGASVTVRRSTTLSAGNSSLRFSMGGPKIVAPNDPRSLFVAIQDFRVGR